ncbi:MAG: DEAD/DEAH box helicase [Actinobacteria bacterium]|nr:DEAD/DEAH box helicase [Actinomycetota bacterium]
MSTSFADLGVPEHLVRGLAQRDINSAFPIQVAAIPDALAGRDVLGRAPTGSGKTLAFGLPLLANVGKAEPKRPHALVLSPTRELADQIRREIAPLGAARGVRVAAVYGGVPYGQQRHKLHAGVEILIACPGRLADLIERGSVKLDNIKTVVIDEADRLADMGFLPEVKRLLDKTPKDRQTILFSATLDGDVKVLTEQYQTNAVRHEVGSDKPDAGDALHYFWSCENSDKILITADLVDDHAPAIVFARTRRGVDRIARQLKDQGVSTVALHGGRTQGQRNRALRAFTEGEADALVATDVAARGIHVDGVSLVVHLDPPEDDKTYLHRSGRTARAGKKGSVISFVLPDQKRSNQRLQSALGLSGEVTRVGYDDVFDGTGGILGTFEQVGRFKEDPRPRGGSRNGSGNRNRSRNSKGGQHKGQGGRSAGGSRNRTGQKASAGSGGHSGGRSSRGGSQGGSSRKSSSSSHRGRH